MKRETDRPRAAATRGLLAAAALSFLLAACGGGDDAAPPTELPQALALTAPAKQQALGAPVAFASNAADPGRRLTYLWDFGDGTTSSLPDPSHAYAKPGLYTVRLTVTNEAGASRTATATVAAADTAIVQDRLCSGADGTGWCWQRPLPQGNRVTGYAFADDLRGWAVGEAGTLLATVDGGATWQAQASGTELDLSGPVFVNAQVGWVAATNGELLKTRDGGATWQRVSFGRDLGVRELGAADADTAWVMTDYDGAYVTTDGGTRWKRIAAPANASRLTLAGPSDAWASSYWNGSALMHSLDGGTTWSSVALPPVAAGFSRYLDDFRFADARHGLVVASEWGYSSGWNYVSRQVAWRTADGGATWQALGTPPGLSSHAARPVYLLGDAGTIHAAVSYPNALWRSTDAGASWQAVALPAPADTSVSLASLQTDGARRLALRDGRGRLHVSTDGGASWTERSAGGPAGPSLSSVWFFDSREGMALAAGGDSLRTADGGRTWTSTAPAGGYGYGYGWRRAQFLPDGSVGWLITDSGMIYRSTDKGRTWLAPVPQTSTPTYGASDFHFVDALHGWAVAPSPNAWQGSGSAVYSTTNGGSSWQPVAGTETLSGLVSVRFGDTRHGVAVGPAGVAMVTEDGGGSWSPRPTGVGRTLRRVTFADARTAVAVGWGGVIVRSTDQGRTWSRVPSPVTESLADVRFLSATTGYAVGDRGTLLVTRDGGASWTPQRTGARAGLQAVYFLDEQTGWIAGDNGTILATVSGGR